MFKQQKLRVISEDMFLLYMYIYDSGTYGIPGLMARWLLCRNDVGWAW